MSDERVPKQADWQVINGWFVTDNQMYRLSDVTALFKNASLSGESHDHTMDFKSGDKVNITKDLYDKLRAAILERS